MVMLVLCGYQSTMWNMNTRTAKSNSNQCARCLHIYTCLMPMPQKYIGSKCFADNSRITKRHTQARTRISWRFIRSKRTINETRARSKSGYILVQCGVRVNVSGLDASVLIMQSQRRRLRERVPFKVNHDCLQIQFRLFLNVVYTIFLWYCISCVTWRIWRWNFIHSNYMYIVQLHQAWSKSLHTEYFHHCESNWF